jgi:hypothetical protein
VDPLIEAKKLYKQPTPALCDGIGGRSVLPQR